MGVVVSFAAVGAFAPPSPASATIGFRAQSYAGFGAEASGGPITGSKPESKLWYQDGTWWAAMLSPSSSGAHHIYQLDSGAWVDTGVLIDPRPASKDDVLPVGAAIYVLSRSPDATSGPNLLRRFSYASGAYQLDAGFPVEVPGAGVDAVTLALDTTGTLWLTYVQKKKVYVAHTQGSDMAWTSAYALPGAATTSSKGDISAVISFADDTGPAIGVMWSNQTTETDYFAVHRDGAADSAWSIETALSGVLQADNHINLKTAEGRLYAAVKTSATGSSDGLIKLLVRASDGTWTSNTVATVAESNTRPLVLLDMGARRIYVFMTLGATHPHGIVYKTSPLDSISFGGSAITFMQGGSGETISNPTSTKQNVTSVTGIVVMASDGSSYWWNQLGSDTPPSAVATSAATTPGASVPLTLSGSDNENCELEFSIVSGPTHGDLDTITGSACTPGVPNTDTATVTYTPAVGFTGSDSFTYKVNDGMLDSSPATVRVAVASTVDVSPSSVTVSKGRLAGGSLHNLGAEDGAYLQVASTTGKGPKNAWYGSMLGVPGASDGLTMSYVGSNSLPCSQTISIWGFPTSKWIDLDSRTVGPAPVEIAGLTPPGDLAAYVGPGGEVRVRVECSTSTAFSTSADLLEVTYTTS
jgi:hypothetical protein